MTLEQKIADLVMTPNVNQIIQITKAAMEDKQKLFNEMGWDSLNHKINEGDVKCVLRAIIQIAGDQQT